MIGTSLLVVGAAHFLSRRFENAVPKLLLTIQEDPSDTNPDFSYRVGFRAAVTRLASKPMKRVVVVG